ncbi:MAG: cation-transporting P-type ATPase, partial [Candidatus Phytoplasma australasiaticum]|nr:cation-transporting P-type ATPase [Candidatus Phytoplasma australasiaticum]
MNKEDIIKISRLSSDEIWDFFKMQKTGLTTEEVRKRQMLYGLNVMKKSKHFSFGKQFIKQFFSMFAILLWIAGFLAFIIHEKAIGIAIVSVVIVNGIFSFFQEYKAERILSSLSDMIPKQIQVYRNNKIEILDTQKLTIGDLIFLEMGSIIPA